MALISPSTPPPQNGHKAGDEAFVEVIIRQAVPTYLMRLLNFDLVDVSTRAVAGVGPPDNCIWVLDPDAEKALNVESGASVEVGCGIQVDSNSSIAISITSGSYVEATSIKIVGGYEATSGSSVDPTPDTGVSPVSDPMAEMSAPTYGACDYFDTLVDGGSATLYPGVYCGNPAIKINSANVTFMPGQYILMGGLHIDQGTIQAVGVSFYNTAGGGYNYEPIFIGSNVVGTFSAPISGDMMGVLFFTDRNAPEDLDNRIQSNTQLFFQGLLYFPTQLLSFLSGTSGISPNTMIVARLLKVSSNSTLILNSDFSDEAPPPTALSRVTLVE